jgi:hypothetical protein
MPHCHLHQDLYANRFNVVSLDRISLTYSLTGPSQNESIWAVEMNIIKLSCPLFHLKTSFAEFLSTSLINEPILHKRFIKFHSLFQHHDGCIMFNSNKLKICSPKLRGN